MVLEFTSHRDLTFSTGPEVVYRRIYFIVFDVVLSELSKRFQHSGPTMEGIAACSPNCSSFFDVEAIKALAAVFGIDIRSSAPQLAEAKNVLESGGANTVEQAVDIIASMVDAFPAVLQLLKLALTFPITSARDEISFSALKRIKI